MMRHASIQERIAGLASSDPYEKMRAGARQLHVIILGYLKEENGTREQYTLADNALRARLASVDAKERAGLLADGAKESRAAANEQYQLDRLNAQNVYDNRRALADLEYGRAIAYLRSHGAALNEFEAASASHRQALERLGVEERERGARKEFGERQGQAQTLHKIEMEGARDRFEYRRALAKAEYDNSVMMLQREGIASPENLRRASQAYARKQERIRVDEEVSKVQESFGGIRRFTTSVEDLGRVMGNEGLAHTFQAISAMMRLVQSIGMMGARSDGGGFGIFGVLTSFLGGFEGGGYTGAGAAGAPAGIVHRGEIVFEKPLVDRAGGELMALRNRMQSGTPMWGTNPPTIVVRTEKPVVHVELTGTLEGQTFLRREMDAYERWRAKKFA